MIDKRNHADEGWLDQFYETWVLNMSMGSIDVELLDSLEGGLVEAGGKDGEGECWGMELCCEEEEAFLGVDDLRLEVDIPFGGKVNHEYLLVNNY